MIPLVAVTPAPGPVDCVGTLVWPACGTAHVIVDGVTGQGFDLVWLFFAVVAISVALGLALVAVLVGYTVARR